MVYNGALIKKRIFEMTKKQKAVGMIFSEFECWKNKIKEINGGKKLIEYLEKDDKNFLAWLAEFNIAKLLIESGKDIKYENDGKSVTEDFVFDNIEISVKSILPKNYQNDNEKFIQKLILRAKKNKSKITDARSVSSKIGSSLIIYDVEPNGDWESCETLEPNCESKIFETEKFQKSKILQYLAEFENKQVNNKKRIIIFIIQNSDCPNRYFKEIASFYYHNKCFDNDNTPYKEMFRSKSCIKRKRGNIDAIVIIRRPNENLLLWKSKDFFKKENQEDKILIFPKSKIKNTLQIFFPKYSGLIIDKNCKE